MYKLIAVGGKLRGQEFPLNDGENTVGRSSDCGISLSVDGISKIHMKITVNNDTVYVEDMGSSNGTFINGKMIKKATGKNGDTVALPNVIFQLVHVVEKKIIIKKQVAKVSGDNDSKYDLEIPEEAPSSLPGKVVYIFKTKILPPIYGFNQQYEWSVMFGILLFAFITTNIFLIIYPVLTESKRILVGEIALRGKQYADEVARTNSVALSRRDLDKIDTNFLDQEGVQGYELFDLEGRIVRPIGKLNSYTNDSFSVNAQKFFREEKNYSEPFLDYLGENQIGIARAIKAYDVKMGREEAVGVIAIRFAPKSLVVEASNNSKAFFESLTTSGLVAIVFFGMIYFLTVRPIEEMKNQIELVLRGRLRELDSKQMFKELNPLRSSINSILVRIKELQNTDGAEVQQLEEDGPYIRTLVEMMQGAQGPVMILDSEKKIQNINLEGEDLVGIRENASQGQNILDVARDQGFAATVIDLCDQSANNGGVNQKENYEIQGKDMRVNVVALMGKDRFAKAFYITFVRTDK